MNGAATSLKRRLVANGDCLEWRGARTAGGYGGLRRHGRFIYAHRLAYELVHGPIPDGLELDHLCRNPSCCNPDHLQAVTHKENILRASSTHCPHGHRFTPANTYRRPSGGRKCRACQRAGAKKSHRRDSEGNVDAVVETKSLIVTDVTLG